MISVKLFLLAVLTTACVVQPSSGLSVTLKKIIHELINSVYVGYIKINDVEYQVLFDTSQPDLIIPGDSCTADGCACEGVTVKLPNPTPGGPVNTKLDDTIDITGAIDSVKLLVEEEGADQLEIAAQDIIVASAIGANFCSLNANGVFGLANPNAGTSKVGTPPLASFFNSGEIDKLFSVHHGRFINGDHYGEVIFGASDSNYHLNDFVYAPLVDPATWNFKLDTIKIGADDVFAENNAEYNAFVDTSKSIILGPAKIVTKINEKFGCTTSQLDGHRICKFDNCDQAIANIPDVEFIIAGKSFKITADHHIQQKDGICYSGFTGCGRTKEFRLGDFFIDHVYCEFNAEENKMGFASAIPQDD